MRKDLEREVEELRLMKANKVEQADVDVAHVEPEQADDEAAAVE